MTSPPPPSAPEPPAPSLGPPWGGPAAPTQPAATASPTQAPFSYQAPYPTSPDGAWAWNGYQWVPTFAGYAPAARAYRALGSVSTLVIVALLVGVVGSAVAAGSFVHRHSLVDDLVNSQGGHFNATDAQNADNFVTGAVGVWAAIVILTCIPFLIWLHRAAANLPALGARELRFSPGWAVGWWFVPLANYVMPVAAVVEVWKASDPGAPPTTDRARRRALAVGALIPTWWLLWIGGNLVFTFARSATDDLAALGTADAWRAAGFAAIAAAGILAAVLVSMLTARQDARARAFAEGRLAP